MLINNMAFDCSRTYYDTNRLLRTCAGHVDRYVEFTPTNVPGRHVMEGFLHLLFLHHTCCFLSGSFVNYVAGNFMSYGAAVLFIAKADTRIQNLLLQRDMTFPYIHLDGYHLYLTEQHPDDDAYLYVLQRDRFQIPLIIFAIDTEQPFCNPFSNVDFVHYVWEYLELFSFKMHAITYVPHHDGNPSSPPRLVYLTHRRAGCEGWRIRTQCALCQDKCMEDHREFTSCTSPGPCPCFMCARQPSSLIASAAQVLFTLTHNTETFQLTANTTYDAYVYAVSSGRVAINRLLPPTFIKFTLYFIFITDSKQRRHMYCHGAGPWLAAHERTFDDAAQAIEELVRDKNTFWCGHCHKPLFFLPSCPNHHTMT
jgi:hypothetical protein